MITLHADGTLIDLVLRLPFAFGVDHLTGPASQNAYWPALTNNQSIFEEELSWDLAHQYTQAVAIRMMLFIAGAACWMVVKFFPVSQMVLSAIWIETAVIFSAILALNIASLYAPLPAVLCIFIVNRYLHTLFILGIRKLRLLELMSLPISVEYQSENTSRLAESHFLTPWPRFSAVILISRFASLSNFDHLFYPVVMSLLAAPATYFLMDAFMWRGYSIFHTLRIRRLNQFRMVVISPYYVAVERCIWHSVGEDIVNRVYALLWLSRVAFHLGSVCYSEGYIGLHLYVPQAIVDATCASFASMCGVAWMATYLYEWLLSYWFKCIHVELATEQNRDFLLMKYDLTSYLATFCYLGNMLNRSFPWSITHLIRILIFFITFRLAFVPLCSGLEVQRQLLSGTVKHRTYVRCVLDGSVFPMLLGLGLASSMWVMPFGFEKLFAGEWLNDQKKTFPADFEVWMHGEIVLALFDIFFMSVSTSVTALAGHAHLIADGNPRFWHIVLQNTEAVCKWYSDFIREFLSAFLHSLVLTTLWEERTGVVLSITYMSRLMEDMGALHDACSKEFTTQFFCWSKCIIRALESPDEKMFKEWKDVCSICRIEEAVRENLCFLPCRHFYHRECIEEWLKRQMRCPMCMRRIVFRNGEVGMDKLS